MCCSCRECDGYKYTSCDKIDWKIRNSSLTYERSFQEPVTAQLRNLLEAGGWQKWVVSWRGCNDIGWFLRIQINVWKKNTSSILPGLLALVNLSVLSFDLDTLLPLCSSKHPFYFLAKPVPSKHNNQVLKLFWFIFQHSLPIHSRSPFI